MTITPACSNCQFMLSSGSSRYCLHDPKMVEVRPAQVCDSWRFGVYPDSLTAHLTSTHALSS